MSETIRYAVTNTNLGQLAVATSDIGVCLAVFGDDPTSLAEEVARRFPKARVVPAASEHAAWVRAAVDVIEGAETASDSLPLDPRGTDFQQQVWSALRSIASGKILTYSGLAAAMGRPSATRAVARACGANPLAVIVPCHRVLGANCNLTGYRWGVDRKRKLLEREGAWPIAGG